VVNKVDKPITEVKYTLHVLKRVNEL
jgi:hypothetical protein